MPKNIGQGFLFYRSFLLLNILDKFSMAKATDLNSAMTAIGINSPTIPADADLSDVVTTTPQPENTPAPTTPATDKSVKPEEEEANQSTDTQKESEAGESSEETAEAEDEKQRRTWQGEADKAKAEAKRIQAEADARRAELEIERQKNQALMNMLAGVNSLRGNQAPAEAPKEQVRAKGEPSLWDFIKREEYDKDDVSDPDSLSGRAYQAWQDARAEYKETQRYQARRAQEAEEQARQMTLKQANDFVNAFPEYKNPFTGEPDLARINGWLESLSKTDWVTLKRALDGQKTNGTHTPPPAPKPESAEAAIGKRANKPDSVASRGSAPPAPKQVPKEVQALIDLYGTVDIPRDMVSP